MRLRLFRYDFFIIILVLTYGTIFGLLSLNRHYTFRSCGADLGIFSQAFWITISQKKFFYNTIEYYWTGIATHFGVHSSYVLLFLLPIYKIFSYPETLILINVLSITISGYALYMLSKEVLQDEKMSFLLTILYFFNSSLHGITLFDFHPVAIGIPLIFLFTLSTEKKQYRKSILYTLLIFLIKEDAPLAVISLTLLYMLRDKDIFNIKTYYDLLNRMLNKQLTSIEKFTITLIFLSVLWILTHLLVIIPFFAKNAYYFSYRYSSSCALYRAPYKILYFLLFNLSLGMLVFLGKWKYVFLLTFLPWAELLLSCEKNMFTIGHHYPYILLPLSFIAIIHTLNEFPKEQAKKFLTIGVIIGVTTSILTTPALPPLNHNIAKIPVLRYPYEPITPHHKLLLEITDVLNNCSCSILTQNDIFPHLANRDNTYLIWSDMIGKNYTYLTDVLKIDVILIDSNLKWGKYNSILLPKDFNEYYIEVYENDGIEIYIRKDKLNNKEIEKVIEKLRKIK